MGKNNPKSNRRTNVDPARQAAVESLISAQYTNSQITTEIVKQFGVTSRTVSNDIARQLHRGHEDNKERRTQGRARMRMTLRAGMRKAMKANNHSAALGYAKEISKLDGLYQPEKIEVGMSAEVEDIVKKALGMSAMERASRIWNLERELELESETGEGETDDETDDDETIQAPD